MNFLTMSRSNLPRIENSRVTYPSSSRYLLSPAHCQSSSTPDSPTPFPMWPSLINAIRVEFNNFHVWPRETPSIDTQSGQGSAPHSAYDDERRGHQSLKHPHLGIYRTHNFRISRRTSLGNDTITLHGWPSRGGTIVLENATPPDFDFLHLDALDPPLRRDPDQSAEDAFCQALLRLGATWWDSEARYDFVRKLELFNEEAHDAVEANENLAPSRREQGWVRVAWPSHPPGALCVLACEKLIMGRNGTEKLRPRHYGIVSLVRTMDERYIVLQRLGGTVYASIDEYRGPTFLKAWEEDHQGEKCPLVKEEFIDPRTYGGHPDDALGGFGTSTSST